MNAIIESIEERIAALKDLKKSTKALFEHAAKEAGAFNPEKEGFRLVAADVKSLCIVYIHDSFVLPVPSRRLYLDFSPYRLSHDRYGLSTCTPSKNTAKGAEPGTGFTVYRGPIDSGEHYREIIERVIKFKLKEGDLVECGTPEERKRVVDAHLKFDASQKKRDFFLGPEYDVQKYPNFRWSKGKLNAYVDPNKYKWLAEPSSILPIDEFIKRMENGKWDEQLEKPFWNKDLKPKKKSSWMHME